DLCMEHHASDHPATLWVIQPLRSRTQQQQASSSIPSAGDTNETFAIDQDARPDADDIRCVPDLESVSPPPSSSAPPDPSPDRVPASASPPFVPQLGSNADSASQTVTVSSSFSSEVVGVPDRETSAACAPHVDAGLAPPATASSGASSPYASSPNSGVAFAPE